MATVTLTFSDTERGTVACDIEFDPPAKKGQAMTPAQAAAMDALSSLQESMREEEE